MKFAICNLGCKVNNYEANWYSEQLRQKYEEVDFSEWADIYIINSCVVTNKAGSKSRQMMHRARKKNPDAIICAVSCYVQMENDKPENFNDCDILIGSTRKTELPELIEQFISTREKINVVEKFEKTGFEQMEIDNFNQTRAYLKIQDGCNQFCSYCVIPFSRGRERCLPADSVIRQAQKLVDAGHLEIVLTGIHTGRWTDGQLHLADLMARMLKEVEGLQRIRLSSIEMTEVSDQLIELMKQDERIARHLHIPLQTGTDRLLKLNNRPYTTSQYKERIEYIRQELPGISISSDIIAGLPTETVEEARQTEEFIESCHLSFMHVFPYAKKEHTVDATLTPQVSEAEKSRRAASLTELRNRLYNEYASTLVGRQLDVIFETCKQGSYHGHASEYVEVIVNSEEDVRGQLRKVQIEECQGQRLYGRLV